MIDSKTKEISVTNVHPQTGYFLNSSASALHKFLILEDHCGDCIRMSRISMSCYAATKHPIEKNGTVARIQPKEKPKTAKNLNKYGEMETTLSLDKYNGKLMMSIWGRYNRNSPHNFKKQNAEPVVLEKGQVAANITEANFKSPLVQFYMPNFSGMFAVETKLEVKKPQTTLETYESLVNFPIF